MSCNSRKRNAMDKIVAELIARSGTREQIARGTTFVQQGVALPNLYYVLKGDVKIEQTVVSGKSMLFACASEVNWLGDLELFSDGEEANSTATAITDLDVVRFSMDLMRKQLKRQPELGEIFARSLAAKMWAYSKLSAVNTLYPLLDRYAAYLYRMSAESLEFPIALATSAGLLGAGERQLQRVLRTLAERGVIARAGRTLTIIDREGLKRLAGDLL